jgi:transposase
VRADLETALAACEARLAELQRAVQAVIARDRSLAAAYAHLCSVKGIAAVSAIHLLGELSVLSPELTARQWVAHAGLDPRPWQSGTSVHKPAPISRTGNQHLRRALFMPALVAARHEPHVRAFYQQLVARGKTRLQAIVAVMRKLLHAIYRMWKHDADFDGRSFTLWLDKSEESI